MLRLKFNDYQITIDGAKEDHDRTRNYKGAPSFDIILKNICILCNVIPNANITLRFNYTSINIRPEKIISEVNSIIPKELRERILLLPRKVLINQLIDGFRSSGYKTYSIDIAPDFSSCYVDKIHYNAIYPNGAVGKCTTHDINDVKGHLKSNGSIEWAMDYLENKIDIPFFENKMCLSCKHLPVCMGPCPQENGMTKIDLEKIECPYTDVDATHEDDILRYCIDIITQQSYSLL
jgi:uncharacterized protein